MIITRSRSFGYAGSKIASYVSKSTERDSSRL
jgi:hypothetical protein